MSLFGGDVKKALDAIRSAFPDLEIDAEMQRLPGHRSTKVLCVVVRGWAESGRGALSADEASSFAPRVWQVAKSSWDLPLVLSSVIDSDGKEWLVNEMGNLETF